MMDGDDTAHQARYMAGCNGCSRCTEIVKGMEGIDV